MSVGPQETGDGDNTVADPPADPAPVRAASPSAASDAGSAAGRTVGASGTTVGSPLEALHRAEILSTRGFCKTTIAIGLAGAAAVPLLPGHELSRYIFLGAIGTAIVALVYLYHRTNSPQTFHDGNGVAIGWYIPAVAVCGAVPFFGPFSPVPVVLVLGIYFTSLGKSRRLAFWIYATCAAVQALCGTLVIADAIDAGFIRVDYLPLRVQILCQILVQVVLLGTFLIARAHRQSSLTALGELERAVRAVAQREALLEEARDELRRAIGAGRGRFTEQMIGRFRLGDVIGRGGMGEVYEATDTTTNQLVAVKMLGQSSLGDASHVQRFLRELRTAASVISPHVVRVIDIGEQPLPHMVMERLRGRDLAAVLRGKRLMPHDQVIDMLRQVSAGITAAGTAGVIHRDLKPQNLFLTGTTWKILDFGVARLANSGDTLTAGGIVGTPAYMAPEQARGADVQHSADLYALAAIAYRALTGHPPFSGGEAVDVLYRVVHTAPRLPSSLAVLPDDVDLVLAVGLAKEPHDRFATAEEMVSALAAALSSSLDPANRARGLMMVVSGAWANQRVARPAV